MSEDIDKIWMDGIPKDKRLVMINICAITTEILVGRSNLEYIKEKMGNILNEVKKISAD